MRQITARLLEVLLSVLARIGLTSRSRDGTDEYQMGVQESAALSKQEGCREGVQESRIEESVSGIQVVASGEGGTDPEPTGRETPEALAEQNQSMRGTEEASECGSSFEGDDGKGMISVYSGPPFSPDTIEHDPMPKTMHIGVVDSSAEGPAGSDEMADAPVEGESTESTVGPGCSIPDGETGDEAPAPVTVPDGRISNGSEHEDDSAHPEDTHAGDGSVDHKSVEDDALQFDEATPRSDPHPPVAVQRQSIATITAPNAAELTGANASADTPTSLADLQDEDLCRRETLSEERKTASVGVWTSDSGGVDRPQAEEEPKKPTGEHASAVADDRRVPSPRQPTPREDAHEYAVAVQHVSAADREYARWNNAVVEQLLLAGPASEEALLCVNPRILARVFEEAGLGSITPEQAEQQFTTAVANLYQRRVLGHGARLRVLRRCSPGGPPDCVAFLAASVLAAFRMQSDEELSGNAYYSRLADLLKCEVQGAHPSGFDPPAFESLWVFLGNWLCEVHGRQLAMPRGDVGFRRFVALPLAHAPLRSLDIEKFPAFFSWAGYQPGARVQHDHLLTDLRRWQQLRNMLTPTGADALYDDRSSAVSAQARAELEAWDGSCYESARRRSSLVEIQFDVVQRSPIFFYLPRRPPGFPRVFEDGERVFEASDEGWYDPAQLRPEDGELLECGFEWLSHKKGIDYTMRRSGALVIPFTPSSSYSGFLSGRRLLRRVRCSVLCRDDIVSIVKDYLSEVAQDLMSPVSHPQLPSGWSMFHDFSARVHVEAPDGLEALEVDQNIELIVAGGLRIGRRWSWLTGAPPRILVSGMEAQDRITVNGASVEVDSSGELRASGVFAEPGEYLVEAGGLRRRIKIEQPRVSVQSDTKLHETLDAVRSRRIALPGGSWTLIGSSPDQVCYSHGEFSRGTIASCTFRPSWAVQVGTGPGAVVAVTAYPSPPQRLRVRGRTGQTRKLLERWSSVVYAAHIRRPQFVGLNGYVPNEGIVGVWKSYVSLAKQIKRMLKKTR